MALKITVRLKLPAFFTDLGEFFRFVHFYIRNRFYRWFSKFELFKDIVVDFLYQKRGKYVRPFLHFGTIGLLFLVITVGPVLFESREDETQMQATQGILQATAFGTGLLLSG